MSGITLDQVVLSHTTDSIQIGDGTDFLAVNNDGSINITDNGGSITVDGSVTVSATDLDIRDLTHVSDSVKIGDGTDFLAIEADGSINVNLSSTVGDDDPYTENPVPVGGRGVSGLLSALSASGDKFDLLGDLYRRVWINSSRNIAILNSAASVTGTAAQVLATPLAGRREVTIQNNSNESVYIGSSAAVTAANGLELKKSTSATYELAEDIDIYMISSGGSADVRFFEMA